MQQNNRFQAGNSVGNNMQHGNYHHRNPYVQQQNGGVNGSANGIIVDVSAPQINGDTSPINGIAAATAGVAAVELYGATGDDLAQTPQASQQNAQAQVYSNLNSTNAYPAAPSPNPGLYSAGQYMVDTGVQNMMGKFFILFTLTKKKKGKSKSILFCVF